MAWLRAMRVAAMGAALWGFWLPGTAELVAQSGVQDAAQNANDALRVLAGAAGVIFTGTVTAVRRPRLADGTLGGVVEIDFAVTDAIRGVAGATYTLREWAGLWEANDAPFRAGQRYLMLLHTPNTAGLSSPVGGPDGAIPIRGAAASAASTSQAAGVGADGQIAVPAGEVVDLGWIATRVVAPLVYRGAHAGPVAARGNPETVAAAPVGGGSAAQHGGTAYAAVLATMRTWEAARNDAR